MSAYMFENIAKIKCTGDGNPPDVGTFYRRIDRQIERRFHADQFPWAQIDKSLDNLIIVVIFFRERTGKLTISLRIWELYI